MHTFKKNDFIDIQTSDNDHYIRCLCLSFEQTSVKAIMPGDKDPKHFRINDVSVVTPSQVVLGDTVRLRKSVRMIHDNVVISPEQSRLLLVASVDPPNCIASIVPIEQRDVEPTRVRFDVLCPVAPPTFYPGTRVLVTTEKGKRKATVICVETDGSVPIEYDDPVGRHSYDGYGRQRHCDIVSENQLEVLTC